MPHFYSRREYEGGACEHVTSYRDHAEHSDYCAAIEEVYVNTSSVTTNMQSIGLWLLHNHREYDVYRKFRSNLPVAICSKSQFRSIVKNILCMWLLNTNKCACVFRKVFARLLFVFRQVFMWLTYFARSKDASKCQQNYASFGETSGWFQEYSSPTEKIYTNIYCTVFLRMYRILMTS